MLDGKHKSGVKDESYNKTKQTKNNDWQAHIYIVVHAP